jgi:uncharacterized protein (TIGR02246 family)
MARSGLRRLFAPWRPKSRFLHAIRGSSVAKETTMAQTRPEDMHQMFARHFNAGDLEAVMALYTPDAALVPQPGQVVTGQAAIREALQAFLALRGKIELQTTYIVEAGDTALMRGQWRLNGTGPDGQPVALSGKSNEVLRKQPDGSWLFAVDHPYGAD